MKILYLITQGEQGGAQYYISTLAKAAKSQNMAVNVAIGEKADNWLSQQIEATGGKFWPLKHLKRAPSPLNDILAIFELAKLYQNVKPDIIHLNSSKAGIIGSLAALLHKISFHKVKIIYTAHGWVFNEPMPWPIKTAYYLMEKITASLKTKIICVSEFDRQIALQAKIAPAKKLITIHNGLTLPDNYFLTKETALEKLKISQDNNTIIVTIANFYPTKGLKYLIEATKILSTDYKLPIKTIIIGDGKLRHQLEQQIKNLELQNNVILIGSLLEASQYLKAFDLAVVSSVKEGFPYFLLEAMSAGLPIVATRVGGIPEIITGKKNGFLVESKNPQMLADKIQQLAMNKTLMAEISDQNLKDVGEKFGLQKMLAETISVYNN